MIELWRKNENSRQTYRFLTYQLHSLQLSIHLTEVAVTTLAVHSNYYIIAIRPRKWFELKL